jgi:hypothetical protein
VNHLAIAKPSTGKQKTVKHFMKYADTLTIRESKDDTLNRKRITRVTLTCCYMGDQAIIDKETNKVLEYIPSDK